MDTHIPNRKEIIVNGSPASGKSTIAREMVRSFNLPILERDTIQEVLYGVIGTGDRSTIACSAGLVWSSYGR